MKKKGNVIIIIIKLLISFIGFVNEISGHWYSLEMWDLLILIIILTNFTVLQKNIYLVKELYHAKKKEEN